MSKSFEIGKTSLSKGRRRVLAAASVLPGAAVSSKALCETIAARFDIKTSIYARLLAPKLGVAHRHLCRDFHAAHEAPRPGHRNPELAALAVQKALNQAGIEANDLGYLISHTTTPSQLLPPGSFEVAQLLKFAGPHMELRQACTGFANALQIAFAMTASADAAPIAIVGSETGSVYFSPEVLRGDQSQWVNFLQMGDGAAAIIIAPDSPASVKPETHLGYISSAYFGQCQNPPASGLRLLVGGSDHTDHQPDHPILFEHDFKSVAEHGAYLLEAGRAILAQQGYAVEDAQFLIPHQASGALAAWLAQRWNVPEESISHHANQVGNLGSASIWAAFVDFVETTQEIERRSQQPVLVFGAEATQYSYGGFVFEFA